MFILHVHVHCYYLVSCPDPCRRILSQFSWLAVHSLSEAAEASSAPVRIGVAKPLGASSVLPEYQGKSWTLLGMIMSSFSNCHNLSCRYMYTFFLSKYKCIYAMSCIYACSHHVSVHVHLHIWTEKEVLRIFMKSLSALLEWVYLYF
jgi:hypothetical protein